MWLCLQEVWGEHKTCMQWNEASGAPQSCTCASHGTGSPPSLALSSDKADLPVHSVSEPFCPTNFRSTCQTCLHLLVQNAEKGVLSTAKTSTGTKKTQHTESSRDKHSAPVALPKPAWTRAQQEKLGLYVQLLYRGEQRRPLTELPSWIQSGVITALNKCLEGSCLSDTARGAGLLESAHLAPREPHMVTYSFNLHVGGTDKRNRSSSWHVWGQPGVYEAMSLKANKQINK